MYSCKLANFRLTVVLAGMMSRTFLKGCLNDFILPIRTNNQSSNA
ncbi:hypothetical protein HMPREF0541_02027 [Lacticaseibacillus rhamnosus ATCC 21052]|nr:hypothetical protein HMPREF0541_02027 [Lacticaseibacillus rhamnosus ATCC 21052]